MSTIDSAVDERVRHEFEATLRGSVVGPKDAEYDEARSVWNAMIDRYPALIVRCAGVADVRGALAFARENGLQVAVRGGGHNIAGTAVADDALVVDLSGMRGVRVDPEARTARVEAGALLADVDHETQAFGLAVPLGVNSTTGVAGLTLGGGFGWLSRAYGMTVDNLRSVDMVTADGEFLMVDADSHPELFWGLRGGSGNFGVVTSFTYDLHPVGPEVYSGAVLYALEDAREVMDAYREFAAGAADEVAIWTVFRKAPPLPFLDESVVGTDVLVLLGLYAGDMETGEKALAPIAALAGKEPVGNGLAPHPYAGFQQAIDPLLEPGMRNYWKTHNFTELSDEAVETAIEYAGNLPSPQTEIFFGHLGGEMGRVDPDETAYPHRDAEFVMNVHARWEDPERDDECITWARGFHHAMGPYATGGGYVNFISERAGEERVAYGDNYDRLVALKDQYDPENVFAVNQNVKPTAAQ